MQTTAHVLMVRPARFVSNPETARSNAFQQAGLAADAAQRAALEEFDAYVALLRAAGVNVLVVEDTPEPHTPDSIFPNNWVSFHADGRALLYPMEAENRRLERRTEVLAAVSARFALKERIDLSGFERTGCYLEGTGSMVLDRQHRIAYVCRSSRSHPLAMQAFVAQTGYRAVWFDAVDRRGVPVYHTNVLMGVGTRVAVVCLEAIADEAERQQLVRLLEATGKRVLAISLGQMDEFAGNMLELRSQRGHAVWAMSRRAWASLDVAQRSLIADHAEPVLAPIDTIERLGGGGARCMLAEIFLPLSGAARPETNRDLPSQAPLPA